MLKGVLFVTNWLLRVVFEFVLVLPTLEFASRHGVGL